MNSHGSPQRRILTYGTFDLLHHGHLRLLERLREVGDWLGVGVSTDEFNEVKGKLAHESFEVRVARLQDSGLVDHVFAEEDWEQKPRDIHRLRIHVFAMGADWQGRFDHLAATGVRVLYLPRTPEIDSTRIRRKLEHGSPAPDRDDLEVPH